jgi:isoamylase
VTAPGDPHVLGATVQEDGAGVNFAVVSTVADSVSVCLISESGAEERIKLNEYDAGVWNGFIPGIGPGQAYGYRVEGPWDPEAGLRCNPGKLLLDPYARAIHGGVRFGPEVRDYDAGNPDQPSELNSAGFVPLSLVVGPG